MRKKSEESLRELPPKHPGLKAFSQIADKFKSFRPAREVLRAVKAVPTIFPQIDHGTRVGGWPIERVGVVHGPSAHGKAQPLDEIVLTPKGWVEIGQISVGDEVIGSDGRPIQVTGVFPQGKKSIVKITTDDGGSARCCEEHLWYTTTENELNRGRYVRGPRPERKRIPTGQDGAGSIKTALEIKATLGDLHYLPTITSCVCFDGSTENLPLDPYYLGVLLGDGSIINYSATVTSQDEEIFEAIERQARAYGDRVVRINYENRCPGVRISGGLQGQSEGSYTRKSLEKLNLWGCRSADKFIPEAYLRSSSHNLLQLLRGLMDTDGCPSNEGQQGQFSTSSPRLRDGLVDIVRSLGGRAYVYSHETPSLPSWCVMVSFPDSTNPFQLERKASKWRPRRFALRRRIVRIDPMGEAECVCISVSATDSLYVTRDHLVTHNTIFCHGLGLSFLQRGHLYVFIDAEMTTPITWVEKLFGEHADTPKFMAMRPRTYEEAVDGVRELCDQLVEMREKEIVPQETSALIVVDSIRKLIPKNLMARIEKDGAAGDKGSVDGYGGRGAQYKASLNAAWLDELVPLMYHSSATIIFIAREAEDAEASVNDRRYGQAWKMGGGKALEYDSSLVARISRAGFTKIGSDENAMIVGERHCVDIRKTKVAAKEDKTTRCYFHTSNGKMSPEGFDRARDVVELAIRFGVVEVAGSWHNWKGHKFQGLNKTLDKLHADPQLLSELEVDTRAKFESAPVLEVDSDGVAQE